MRRRSSLLAVVAIALAGCTVGTGDGTGGATGPVVEDAGGLGGAVGTTAPWLVLDLASGAVSPATALADLAGNPAYRDARLAFRRCPAGAVAIGQADAWGRQDGEAAASATVPAFYIAVFEITRAQWRRLAGDEPWTALSPAPAAGGDDLPATGMSLTRVRAVLAAWNARGRGVLALPSPVQWEAAVRAGTATVFPWGDSHDPDIAAVHALTWDAGQPAGPAPVGGRAGNALGMYDGCGNVWEFTDDGAIRGGSWGDALAVARPANRAEIAAGAGHETVGLRLVYRP